MEMNKKKTLQKGSSWCPSCSWWTRTIGDGIRWRRRRRPRRRRCGWPSSSPATCRCRCTTSRRTPRTRSRPASSTRSLHECEHRSRAPKQAAPHPAAACMGSAAVARSGGQEATVHLAAWRSRGCGRRRARPPARGARRRATRPRSRTGAGSACASFRRA